MSSTRCWEHLPQEVRTAIRTHTGEIREATPAPEAAESDSTQLMAVLRTAENTAYFLKAMPADAARSHKWESAVNSYLTPLTPALEWRVREAGWDVLGFRYIENARTMSYAPAAHDLPLLVEAMTKLSATTVPDTIPLITPEDHWAPYLPSTEDATRLKGDTLLHTTWHPTNVLLTSENEGEGKGETTRPHLVDWSRATRGAAWIDPACWVVRLIRAGHTPQTAEQWAAKVPAWSSATSEDLDVFTTVQARMWKAKAQQHPNAWTYRLRDAAATWAAHRAH